MNDQLTPEEQVIGSCMYPNDAYREVAKIVRPEDFQNFRLGQIFRIIGHLDFAGTVPDPGTISEMFAHPFEVVNFTAADLWHILERVPTGAVGEFYAQRVHDMAQRRRAHALMLKANQDLQHDGIPAGDTMANLVTEVQKLIEDSGATERIDPKLMFDILQDDDDYDWLSVGLLEKGDRLIWTGPEGGGKTTKLRIDAAMFAAGIHPITGAKVAPLKVLYIDPENSAVQWRREIRPILRTAARQGTANPMMYMRLAITPRLNLVEGYDLGRIHRLIDEHKPDIIFMGPLYKLTKGSLNNEDDAAALINSLDSIHDRGVVLIMEAHSAKGGFGQRNWTPRGSAALAGWPEFGFALVPDPDNMQVANVERWRGDRDAKRMWPKQYERGLMYPWMPIP